MRACVRACLRACVRECRKKKIDHFVFLLLESQTVVLGLSHALDCVESLEKRVRSRFSGRTILFMNAPCAERSCKILSTALSIPDEALVPLQRPVAAESGLFAGKKKISLCA